MFGMTHVCAIDGFSGKIVGFVIMPWKNNITIYEKSHVGDGGSGTATVTPAEGRSPATSGHTPSEEEASGGSTLTEDGSPHVPISSSFSAVVTPPTSTVTVATPTTSTTTTAGTSPSVSFSGSPDIMGTVTRLLQAQTEVMAAQAKAVAVQHLPPLPAYTGEGSQDEEDSFDRWIERFLERAKIAGWAAEQQLYQLKFHLEKSASEVFRMLPETERNTFETVIESLWKRFKPVDM